jgi:hypothetical protein
MRRLDRNVHESGDTILVDIEGPLLHSRSQHESSRSQLGSATAQGYFIQPQTSVLASKVLPISLALLCSETDAESHS